MRAKHPLAGQTVALDITAKAPDIETGMPFTVEDWAENVFGKPWGMMDGNPAAIKYAIRAGMGGLPPDNEVVYGKVGCLGHLVHVSELQEQSSPGGPPVADVPSAASAGAAL